MSNSCSCICMQCSCGAAHVCTDSILRTREQATQHVRKRDCLSICRSPHSRWLRADATWDASCSSTRRLTSRSISPTRIIYRSSGLSCISHRNKNSRRGANRLFGLLCATTRSAAACNSFEMAALEQPSTAVDQVRLHAVRSLLLTVCRFGFQARFSSTTKAARAKQTKNDACARSRLCASVTVPRASTCGRMGTMEASRFVGCLYTRISSTLSWTRATFGCLIRQGLQCNRSCRLASLSIASSPTRPILLAIGETLKKSSCSTV